MMCVWREGLESAFIGSRPETKHIPKHESYVPGKVLPETSAKKKAPNICSLVRRVRANENTSVTDARGDFFLVDEVEAIVFPPAASGFTATVTAFSDTGDCSVAFTFDDDIMVKQPINQAVLNVYSCVSVKVLQLALKVMMMITVKRMFAKILTTYLLRLLLYDWSDISLMSDVSRLLFEFSTRTGTEGARCEAFSSGRGKGFCRNRWVSTPLESLLDDRVTFVMLATWHDHTSLGYRWYKKYDKQRIIRLNGGRYFSSKWVGCFIEMMPSATNYIWNVIHFWVIVKRIATVPHAHHIPSLFTPLSRTRGLPG